MAQIDVSAALTNPMSVSVFTVQRRTQVMNEHGRAAINVTTIAPVYGVLYPVDPNSLDRQPDFQVAKKTVRIATRFALQGASDANGKGFQPDIVVWHGDSFLVDTTEDYSNYAAGFIMATCSLHDFIATAPVTE